MEFPEGVKSPWVSNCSEVTSPWELSHSEVESPWASSHSEVKSPWALSHLDVESPWRHSATKSPRASLGSEITEGMTRKYHRVGAARSTWRGLRHTGKLGNLAKMRTCRNW